MSQNTTSAFDHKLEQWISKQGLFFLLVHGSGRGSFMTKLVAIVIRLVILALIALVVVWFMMKAKVETDGFKDNVAQQITKGLNAGNVEISSISRVNGGILSGDMLIGNLKLGETENSFFEDWTTTEYEVSINGGKDDVEIKHTASFNGVNVSPLKIEDNYLKKWSAENVKINSMEIKLKTGADTDAKAQESYASLFKKYESLKLNSISVTEGTIHWGNTTKTAGEIKNANFEILRKADSWEIDITGGVFSYAWLQDAELVRMKVICHASGKIEFNQAFVKIGGGILTFSGQIDILAKPKLDGRYEFKEIKIADLIGAKYESWLGGQLSGIGSYRGTLNSAEGVTYETNVILSAEEDETGEAKESVLILNDRNFEIFDVVQSIDQLHGYSNLRAYEGSISVKYQQLTGASEFELSEVKAGDKALIVMDGTFKVSESDEIPLSVEEEKRSGKIFTGEIKMGFLPRVFEGDINLFEALKANDFVYRIELDADIEGQIDQLTSKAGEKLYQLAEDIAEKAKNNR